MRFTIEFRTTFPSEMKQKYIAYAHTTHPFTLNKEDIYQFGWEKDELLALNLLLHTQRGKGYSQQTGAARRRVSREQIICEGTQFVVNAVSLASKRSYLDSRPMIVLDMGDYHFPDVEFDDTSITNLELRGKLLAWIAEAARHNAVADVVEQKLYAILDRDGGVNTPGQLYRVWPELACVMEERYRGRVVRAKLKSALPDGWDTDKVKEFRSGEHFESINNAFLAMTVMSDLDYTYDYPSVR